MAPPSLPRHAGAPVPGGSLAWQVTQVEEAGTEEVEEEAEEEGGTAGNGGRVEEEAPADTCCKKSVSTVRKMERKCI